MKKRNNVINIIPALLLVLAIAISSCIPNEQSSVGKADTANVKSTSTPDSSLNTSTEPVIDNKMESLLASMTLEEKVGQLFFIASRYLESGENRYEMDKVLREQLQKYKPGGYIFFAQNLDSINQTVSFIDAINENAKIPLFISIDEEGGVTTRLNKAKKLHSTVMPAPYVIGKTKNPQYAYEISKAIAEEIKSLGFNMNFAPVADIFSNPLNTVIAKRAYGSDSEITTKMVAEAVKGFDEGGVIPVLKHFPGHGDTSQDTHTGAAVVENDLKRLESMEFLPFEAGIDAGAEVIMTAHILTPNVTDDNLPATLSKQLLQGILREKLGFDGIIITDGLEMSAISAFYPEEEAVVLAIEAGVDMLLLPVDLEKAYTSILNAVKIGRLTEKRIDESVRRILSLKNKYLYENSDKKLDADITLGSDEHLKLSEKVRKESNK